MSKFSRRLRLASFVALSCSFALPALQADTYYWDGTAGTPNTASEGGSGNWNTTQMLWDFESLAVFWPTFGTDNDAVFGGAAGTVNVTEAIIANSLTFNTTDYILSGGGGSLTFNGAAPSITAGTGITTTVNVPITGTLGFAKLGMGTLNLSGANTHTGITSVTFGTVNVSGDQTAANGGWNISSTDNTTGLTRTVNFLTGSTIAVASGKVFQVGAASASGQLTTLNVAGTVNNAGTLNVQRNAVLNVNSGGIWNQSGSLLLVPPSGSGSGSTLTVNTGGIFNYTGTSTIALNTGAAAASFSTLNINGLFTTGVGFANLTPAAVSPALPSTGISTIAMSGGTLRLTADVPTLTSTSAYGFTFVLGTNGGTIDTNGFATTMSRPFSGSGTLTKAGAGTLTLTAASTHTGTTSVAGGTLLLNAGNNSLVTTTTANFANTSTLDLGTTTQTLANLTFANGANATITGSAGTALTLTSALQEFAPPDSVTAATTISLTSLPSFTYNNPTGTFSTNIKMATGGLNAAVSGGVTLNLPTATTSITAGTMNVGTISAGDGNGSLSTVNLGTTTTLAVNNINVGTSSSRASGTLKFATGLTNPSVTITGATGGTSKSNLIVGSHENFATTFTYSALLDTTAGTMNGQFGSIMIGRVAPSASTTSNRGTSSNSTFRMGAGTFSADSMTIGSITNRTNGTFNYTFNNVGLFSLDNGGTANIGAITLATSAYTDALSTSTNTFNNQLSLLNGTLNATTITRGSIATVEAGTLTVTAQVNWTTGTIGNLAGTNLAISNLPILLTTTGPHAFNISGTNTGTVASTSVISGASSGISKLGTGSLILEAANTYGGGTTVTAGTLLVNNTTNSGTGTGQVMIGANGTLGGSGTIAGATTIAGTLAPGNSIDSLTINNTLALSGSAAFEINDSLNTADLVDGVTTLTFGGSLVVTNLGSGTNYFGGQTFNLFDFVTASGTFSSITLPTLPSGMTWQTYGAQTFDYATGQISIAATAIPEPSTLVLAGLGMLGFATASFRRRKHSDNHLTC
jgi:autotransporter-associated beta strand protein